MKIRSVVILALVLIMPIYAGAADAPHYNPSVGYTCTKCHTPTISLDGSGFNNVCFACHSPKDPGAGSNPVTSADEAAIFGTVATHGTSHRFSGTDAVPAAGAQVPTQSAMTLVGAETRNSGALGCIRCHSAHSNANGKFLRMANDQDQMCLDCHRSRNVQSHLKGSHPVNMKYSDAVKANGGGFNDPPLNANPANSTSDLGARMTNSSAGKVLCTTCHGVHFTDSHSGTVDSGTAFANMSSGDGFLLRTDRRGARVAGGSPDNLNICTNCHAGKTSHNGNGQDIQCLDCHGAHVEYDPNDPNNAKGTNIYLIRRYAPGKISPIFFRYTGSAREYKNDAGTGICQGCHAVPTTVSQHASNDPKVCNTCHSHNNGKSSFSATGADHNATLGSGTILMFAGVGNTDHPDGFGIDENCTLCHYTDLVKQHGNNCSLCHSGANPPANAVIGQWNKTCQQASCHPSMHANIGADHRGMYWGSSASCSLCHDGVGGFPGSGDNCSRCHNPDFTVAAVGDHQPTTTTSNAQPSYLGPASIHLTATDAGTSGVSLTWYSLDGKGWSLGNDIYVSAPISGTKGHTLQYYSIDHAMNSEAVRTISFTVQPAVADTTPPTTVSSFNPAAGAAFKTSQAVTLTATDNIGGSGVNSVHYQIDSGGWQMGYPSSASFTISGDGPHSFSYYSLDNALNKETTHVSNTFIIDTVAPVTTCNAVNGANYTGTQTFGLTAADSGSGVAGTWYQIDSGVFTSGSSVMVAAPASGSVSHTVSWYSLDNGGNQETTKSVTFTVQALSADATPPTTVSSFNPAAGANFKASQAVTLTATDNIGGSGVKATYYRIDSGAFTQGTSFTISGDGLYSFSYYSVDNANNSETTHVSNTFRIDTVAPVTTNSAVNGTIYTGTKTFTLTATDSGSGVAGTWYKLDSGAYTSGTSVTVTAPASGSAAHTISWYSLDNAGNQETTQSVTFTVQAAVADTIPPTTTSSFNPAAGANFNAGRTVTLTATDTNSGVKATYYKIDSGAFTQGTSFTVSGDGLHSFSYYSVDNANNTEATHVSNTFRIDTIAPVTICNAANGANYTGAQTVTLTATDSGSGVAGTWYKLDSGAFTSGTSIAVAAPVSGSAAHTISWYSIDNAGNQEATQSVTFNIATAPPSAPTGISVNWGNGQAVISWTAGAGSTKSLVRYGTTTGAYTTTIDPAVSPQTITGLVAGTTIYYQVGAYNTAGTAWSPENSFTFSASAVTQTWATPGSYTFTVPAGVTSITVDALGGGGHGGSGSGGDSTGTFDGASGGNAVVIYQSVVRVNARGGTGGGSTTSDHGAPGGAGGTATGSLTGQTITNGAPGSTGGDDFYDLGTGYGGAGGAPNGYYGSDSNGNGYDGGGGGGGGGARVQGTLTVTPGSIVSITIGTGSSVVMSW